MLAWLVVGCEQVDDRPATWSYIHTAIIAPSCATASCHSEISSIAGRDLSTRESAYTALTGRVCGAPSHPGDPGTDVAEFVFLATLRGQGPGANGEGNVLMPPEQQLPEVEIEIIERWFANGAQCD